MTELYDEEDPEMEAVYKRSRAPADPPTFAEYKARQEDKKAGVISRVMLNHLMKMMNNQEVIPFLISMRWAVVSPNRKYPLLTSDRPIVMTNGIGKPEGHIVMPLSPSRALVCGRSEKILTEIRRMSDSGEFAKNLNEIVVRQARKLVFGTDDQQLTFIRKRLGQRMWASPFEGDGA